MESHEDCAERDRLRGVHRLKIDEWLEELLRSPEPQNLLRTQELKKAISSAMEDLLEHRKRHGC